MIGHAVSTHQPPIERAPIPPIHEALFPMAEGEAATHLGPCRQYALDQHVSGKMQMLMSVQM